MFGGYTCFKWNGSSVVDYLIVLFTPWLSDHCPLSFTLELNRVEKSQNISNMKEAPVQFAWSEKGKNKFLDQLKKNESIEKIEEIMKGSSPTVLQT